MSKKQTSEQSRNCLSEDTVKEILDRWLHKNGWETEIACGRKQGIDIVARKPGEQWIIEVKGWAERPQQRRNYFLNILGVILQRMEGNHTKYSIAFPNTEPYPTLWKNLPALAKKRTKISVLFVEENGRVTESES
jgi:hypothetical protein